MTKTTRNSRLSKLLEIPLPLLPPALPEAFDDLRMSVDRFCLLAGVETLGEMLDEDHVGVRGPKSFNLQMPVAGPQLSAIRLMCHCAAH